MDKKKKLFIGIGIFWLVILVGFIGVKEYTLKTGTEVLLKLRPVDPRDLFRGDYVILRYDISTVSVNNSDQFRVDDTVYTYLNLISGAAHYQSLSKVPRNGLFIKGKVNWVGSSTVGVTYGIESYFVPEGEGRVIERDRSEMFAKVVIDKSGKAVIKSIVKNGVDITF